MTTATLVRELYTAHEERDWDRAGTFLHPDCIIELPTTGERLMGRAAVLEWCRSFPEPWGELSVQRVYADGEADVVARLFVVDTQTRHHVAAFWSALDGALHHGVELWASEGDAPPPSRAGLAATHAARHAWTESHPAN